jgi:hypothetical protein
MPLVLMPSGAIECNFRFLTTEGLIPALDCGNLPCHFSLLGVHNAHFSVYLHLGDHNASSSVSSFVLCDHNVCS